MPKKESIATRVLPRDRRAIAVLLIIGVAAASQLGKVAPIIDDLGRELTADVTTLAWLSSTVSLIGALTGLFVGFVASRVGHERTLVFGLIIMTIGCLLGATATNIQQFIFARIIEGIAYILIFSSIPGLLYLAARSSAPLILAIWAITVPTGVAVAMLIVPFLDSTIGWRHAWQSMSVCFFIFALIAYATGRNEVNSTARDALKTGINLAAVRSPAIIRLAICFFFYAGTWFILVTWTPFLLKSLKAGEQLNIALVSTVVVGANIIGNMAGSFCISRSARTSPLLVTAFSANIIAFLALSQFSNSPYAIFLTATFASLVSGLLPPSIMASISMHSRSPEEVAITNGMVMQASNAAILLMPPAFGFLYAKLTGHQWLAYLFIAFLSLLGLLASIVSSKRD